ncbi:MAG: hypothetical protein U1F10_12615 [Burkholderiales bacterium]
MDTLPDLEGWVPVAASVRDGHLVADLCLVGERPFTEPFFGDSVTACMRLPFNNAFRREAEVATMAAWLAAHPPLPVAGFIFHMSRCGSTLLAQVLGAADGNRVLSEPAPLDEALRGGADDPRIDSATRTAWLRAVVGMLAQRGRPTERRCIVKADSWHAANIAEVLAAFPDTPWLFVVREPVEVIVSHLRRPGPQTVPGLVGLRVPGLADENAVTLPREAYIARVLGAICGAAERAFATAPARGLVVDYAELPAAIESRVLPHFGIRPTPDEHAAMAAALVRDAKNPRTAFTPDADAKRAEATAAVRAAADAWVAESYRRLLALPQARGR